MEFRPFEEKDIAAAAALLADRHRRERKIFPAFRQEFEDSTCTERILRFIWESEGGFAKGVCAFRDGVMAGFLLSVIQNDDMLGRCAYVEYEGVAIAETESSELYREMYAELSQTWQEYGALNQYVTIPAGDPGALEAWLKLSFAIEHVYGIAGLSRAEAANPDGIVIRQAAESDRRDLGDVSNLVWSTHAAPPVFAAALPEKIAGLRKGFEAIPEYDDMICLVAYRGAQLVGFQCASMEEHEFNMMFPEKACEIESAGTVRESRGSGVGSLLTGQMRNRLIEMGYENAIVDWKIANLYASRFWPKQGFRTVAYRMYRRIDERVYWADGIRALRQ